MRSSLFQSYNEFKDWSQSTIRQQLKNAFETKNNLSDGGLLEAILYVIEHPGKAFRPMLCYANAEIFEIDPSKLNAVATALELIHCYSLVHDDLPAMDDDDFRRGKPTCHKVYSEAMAILVGDALLTQAFEVLAAADFSAETKIQLIMTLTKAAGAQGMIAGQAIDIQNSALAIDQLNQMHSLKTGALIEAAVIMGCIAALDDKHCNLEYPKDFYFSQLKKYAKAIGLAFQIQDDVLDVTGEADKIGKPLGSDQAMGKTTYVDLIGIQDCEHKIDELTHEALEALRLLKPHSTGILQEMTVLMTKRAF